MNNPSPPAGFHPSNPLVIIISGPSGVGKDAILHQIKRQNLPYKFITTVTTRAKRPSEKDLVDYQFISEPEFQELLKNRGLLEYASVYGNWYGVPAKPVKEALERGQDTIIKVDVQGSASIKKILPEAVFIFVAPPTLEELADRLKKRRTESEFDLAVRLKTAKEEMRQICQFDYVVVNANGYLDQAVAQIQAIVTAEKCRTKSRQITF